MATVGHQTDAFEPRLRRGRRRRPAHRALPRRPSAPLSCARRATSIGPHLVGTVEKHHRKLRYCTTYATSRSQLYGPGRWPSNFGGTTHDQYRPRRNMFKKLLVSVMAAGAVSIPLAGIASADPTPDNPGVPGNIGGISPGSAIKQVAKMPGPASAPFGPPGHAVRTVAPGHAPKPPAEPDPSDPTDPTGHTVRTDRPGGPGRADRSAERDRPDTR